MAELRWTTAPKAPPVRRWTVRVTVASALLLTACASDGEATKDEIDFSQDARLGEAEDTICFAGRVSGFYALGPRALVLRRTQGEAYLVETGHCPKLSHIEAFAMPEPSRCLSRGDRIFVDDTPFPEAGAVSNQANRCLVTSIHVWDESLKGDDT